MRHPAGIVLPAHPGQDDYSGKDRAKTNDYRSSATLGPPHYQSFHKRRKTSPSFWPLAATTTLTKGKSNRGGKQKNYKKIRIIVIVTVTLADMENSLPWKTCRALWWRENFCTSIVLGVKLNWLSSFSDTDRISHTYIKIVIFIFLHFPTTSIVLVQHVTIVLLPLSLYTIWRANVGGPTWSFDPACCPYISGALPV